MKIAFVNPPRIGRKKRAVEAEDCCWGLGPLVMPSMLLACASEAAQAGHDVSFVDLAIDRELPECDVVIHSLAYQWWKPVNTAMAKVCGNTPRIIIAVPPGYAALYADETSCLCIRGNVESMISAPSTTALQSLFLLGLCVSKKERRGIDRLCPANYSLVPSHYWPHYSAAIYQVTRGCPYRCTFCVWGGSTVTDRTFKMRPPRLVADNLKQLRELSRRYRGDMIPLYLLSAQLTTNEWWIAQFYDEMAADPYPFQSNINLGEVTDGNLALLKDAGLVSCGASLDAPTDWMLQRIRKPFTMERAIEGLLTMQRAGLLRKARVRYGVGENADQVAEACRVLDEIKQAGIERMRVNFAPMIHYEGTRIREAANYELAPLSVRGPERLVMANPPDWSPYIEKLRDMRWLGRVGARK